MDPDVSKSSACCRNGPAVYVQCGERRESAEMGSRLFSLGTQVPVLVTGRMKARAYYAVARPINAFSAAGLVSFACCSTALRPGGASITSLLFHISEGWKSKVKVLAALVFPGA